MRSLLPLLVPGSGSGHVGVVKAGGLSRGGAPVGRHSWSGTSDVTCVHQLRPGLQTILLTILLSINGRD